MTIEKTSINKREIQSDLFRVVLRLNMMISSLIAIGNFWLDPFHFTIPLGILMGAVICFVFRFEVKRNRIVNYSTLYFFVIAYFVVYETLVGFFSHKFVAEPLIYNLISLFTVALLFSGRAQFVSILLILFAATMQVLISFYTSELDIDSFYLFTKENYVRSTIAMLMAGGYCGILVLEYRHLLSRILKNRKDSDAEQVINVKNADLFMNSMTKEARNNLLPMLEVEERLGIPDDTILVRNNIGYVFDVLKGMKRIADDTERLAKASFHEVMVENEEYQTAEMIGGMLNLVRILTTDSAIELQVSVSPSIPSSLIGDYSLIKSVNHCLLSLLHINSEGRIHLAVDGEEKEKQYFLQISVDFLCPRLDYSLDVFEKAEAILAKMNGQLIYEAKTEELHFCYKIPQTKCSSTCIGTLKKQNLKVLYLEPDRQRGENLASILRNINVSFDQAEDEEEFMEKSMSGEYTHLFLDKGIYDTSREIFVSVLHPRDLILIGDMGAVYEDDFIRGYMIRPITALNIVNLLNDRNSYSVFMFDQMKNDFYRFATVMVVDDNEINLEVTSQLLKRYVDQVISVNSGRDAIRTLHKEKVDLIFMDYVMPEMDGRETVENIHKMGEQYEKIPIIVLTSHNAPDAAERFLGEGFTDYMPKPATPQSMTELLKKYLVE